MAEEVGVGYVSLVPSLKNFSRLVKAEIRKQFRDGVEVPVKPVFDDKDFDAGLRDLPAGRQPKIPVQLDPLTEALRAELRKVTRTLAHTLAIDIPVDAKTAGLRRELETAVTEAQAGLTAEIPVDPEGRAQYRAKLRALLASTREKQHVKVDLDYDVDKDRLGKAIKKAEPAAGEGGSLLGKIFSDHFGTALLNPFVGIPILVAAAIGAPLVAAVASGAIVAGLGLGAIFAGAFALRADKDIRGAATSLLAKLDKGLTAAAQPLKGPFLQALSIIGKALKDIAPDIKAFFKTIANSGVVQELARGIGGFLRAFTETGALDKLGTAIVPVLQQLAMALPDLGNAFAQFILSITEDGKGATAADGLGKALRFLADVIRATGDILGFLMGQFNASVTILKTIGRYVGYTALGFQTLNAAFHGSPVAIRQVSQALNELGAIIIRYLVGTPRRAAEELKAVVEFVKRLFDGLRHSAQEKLAAVATSMGQLPGRIKAAVGNLGTLLVQAGKNVVQGLIDGIRSKFGSLSAVASQMAQTIRDFLPFSPAKEGPLSGSGNPYHSGQIIAGDVAKGVQSQLPSVASAADQLASQFNPASAGFGPGVGPAASASIGWDDRATGDALLDAFRDFIRVRFGGDPMMALGSR